MHILCQRHYSLSVWTFVFSSIINNTQNSIRWNFFFNCRNNECNVFPLFMFMLWLQHFNLIYIMNTYIMNCIYIYWRIFATYICIINLAPSKCRKRLLLLKIFFYYWKVNLSTFYEYNQNFYFNYYLLNYQNNKGIGIHFLVINNIYFYSVTTLRTLLCETKLHLSV